MKRFLRITIVAFVILIVAAFLAWHWLLGAPSWYDPPDVSDEQVVALADRVEYRMIEEAQKIRPVADTWSLRIREGQVNAWLAARLRDWINNHSGTTWPTSLGIPQVKIDEKSINLAVPLPRKIGSRTIVISFHPSMEEDRLYLVLGGVAIGRIALPGEPMVNLMRNLEGADASIPDDQSFQAFLDVLSGKTSVEPIVTLADGRCVKLLDFTLHDSAIDLTALTLPEK